MHNVNTTQETQRVIDEIVKARQHYGDQLKIALFPELVAALGVSWCPVCEQRLEVPADYPDCVCSADRALLARCRDV